jgi:ribosomal-protein-alanine N-acetyltransferase
MGFAGFWIMTDEAHIISIATREIHRRQGIGELLLISVIDLAAELKARIITLEVRASNTTAQSLYHKYGFIQVGLRRGYYIDNHEDGILMLSEDINSAPFQEHLQQLKQAHFRKWKIALHQIA